MCYDHYGFDCSGNYVDGESFWCQDKNSIFYYVN